MNKLKEVFRKKGFDLKQIKKNDKWALYEKSVHGFLIAYEVFKITVYPTREIAGKVIEEHEAYPYDEAFGVWAWTTPSLERAMEIMHNNETYETSNNNQKGPGDE